jgi:hypothetical protein
MKIIELSQGWRTAIDNEENQLVTDIRTKGGEISRGSLTPRQKVVAKSLVAKGVLTRIETQGKLYYVIDDASNIWRI